MVPLAVSGMITIGVVLTSALVLLVILLRLEARDTEAEEKRAAERDGQ